MSTPRSNEFGQPVGPPLDDWSSPTDIPGDEPLFGEWCTVRRLLPDDANQLFTACVPAADSLWTYMSFGPFDDADGLAGALTSVDQLPDARTFAVESGGQVVGTASYLRIIQRDGTIEIGSIVFSPALQRTTAATESISLLIGAAFDAGYRRVEWKCDDLNGPSRRAAERYGFIYEGTFRKATQYKGRSRDTAWFAIVDDDWPTIRAAHRSWLDPSNFVDGEQRERLDAAPRPRP